MSKPIVGHQHNDKLVSSLSHQAAALAHQLLQAGSLLTDMKGELVATHWRQPPRARY